MGGRRRGAYARPLTLSGQRQPLGLGDPRQRAAAGRGARRAAGFARLAKKAADEERDSGRREGPPLTGHPGPAQSAAQPAQPSAAPMSDLGFSFSIGAALSSTVGASVGSTVKHLDRLGKAAAGTGWHRVCDVLV